MNFSFIKKLLDHVEGFSQKYPDSTDMSLFAQWLSGQVTPLIPVLPEMSPTETVESVIAKLLIFLNRYARGYLKKALEDTALRSLDEFVFLVNLHHRGPTTKMELIERARLEKPIGMEVWRRLLSAGFVQQENHETDKRSKKVSLTPTGITALMGSFAAMDQVTKVLTANLDEAEKYQLLELLQKLEDFHLSIRHSARSLSWGGFLEECKIV